MAAENFKSDDVNLEVLASSAIGVAASAALSFLQSPFLHDVSATGMKVMLKADPTIPVAVPLIHFSDDANPITVEPQKITQSQILLNGEMWTRRTRKPIVVKIGVIPGSDDDTVLQYLLRQNIIEQVKYKHDNVELSVMYKTINKVDGGGATLGSQTYIFADGAIEDGQLGFTVSDARIETRIYTFAFRKCSLTQI